MDGKYGDDPSDGEQRHPTSGGMGQYSACDEAYAELTDASACPEELDRFRKAMQHVFVCDRCCRSVQVCLGNGLFMINFMVKSFLTDLGPIPPRAKTPPPGRKRGHGKRARMLMRRSRR